MELRSSRLTLRPLTTAACDEALALWQQPGVRRYLWDDRIITRDEALAPLSVSERDFRERNPLVTKTRVVPFTSGHYRRPWVGNVCAVGNSAGFVEPMEATALMVLCMELRALTASLPLHGARFAEELGAWSLNCDVDFVDAGLVADAHRRGLKILVYTVDEVSDGDALAAMGVDSIFTNRPDRFS